MEKDDPSSLRYAVPSKDRVTVLPKSLREEVARQIESAREVWQNDQKAGLAGVYIPGALARKFRRAAETFEWFWLFAARQISTDPESEIRRRHHLHGQVYNEAIKRHSGQPFGSVVSERIKVFLGFFLELEFGREGACQGS